MTPTVTPDVRLLAALMLHGDGDTAGAKQLLTAPAGPPAGRDTFAKDASGHEHKGKGPGGGQFVGHGGGGGGGGDDKPKEKKEPEHKGGEKKGDGDGGKKKEPAEHLPGGSGPEKGDTVPGLKSVAEVTTERVKNEYPKLREAYLKQPGLADFDQHGNLAGVTLNTDEWRPLFPEYHGTNAADVHTASSTANKRLLSEAYQELKGKGNNTTLVLAGGGGCHALDTPIMMADGSVRAVQDIRVGDRLMGPDSRPRAVLELHQGSAAMYRVTPTRGAPFVVNGEHVLSLRGVSRNKAKADRRDITFNITVNEVRARGRRFLRENFLYRVGVEFPARPVDLDPYFMGLWLGDGTHESAHITSADPEVAEYLAGYVKLHPNLRLRVTPKPSNKASTYALAVRGQRESGKEAGEHLNPVIQALKRIGVFRNKHLPDAYVRNDRATRLAVLAGLLDSDGYYGSGCFDFITRSERMAGQMVYLVRSLGMAAYAKPKVCSSQTGFTATYYRVSISGATEEIPTKIKRKQARPRAVTWANGKRTKNVLHTGFTVEPVGAGDYYGFTLDGDGLYLMGDFTVTHNSGKGTATKVHFKQKDYPIRLDQVSDDFDGLMKKLDEAKKNGFDVDYKFIDREPASAWAGVVGRAVDARKRGEPARTVPLAVALKANLDARAVALRVLKERPDIPASVIDNNRGMGKSRHITDRNEAIQYLEGQQHDHQALFDQLHAETVAGAQKGDIPHDIAQGLLAKGH